ncbi:MAG: nucleotidyltransferase family protein [Thermodesulfovibrionales bacterium]|nr:nucleotidyltransferase family protein [Thermodesulfovibrionales bacterium]
MSALELIKNSSGELKDRFHLKSIGVFGSSARGEEGTDSDVDVLVEFEEGHVTFDNYADLKFYLEDLTGRDVDLATPDVLHPRLKERILKETVYA